MVIRSPERAFSFNWYISGSLTCSLISWFLDKNTNMFYLTRLIELCEIPRSRSNTEYRNMSDKWSKEELLRESFVETLVMMIECFIAHFRPLIQPSWPWLESLHTKERHLGQQLFPHCLAQQSVSWTEDTIFPPSRSLPSNK